MNATPDKTPIVGHFVNGAELADDNRPLPVTNPATGQVIRHVAMASAKTVSQAIAAADVLVHCSTVEAAPSVVREARACGVPVVATDAGDVGRWAATDPDIVTTAPHPSAVAAALQQVMDRRNRAPGLPTEPARGTNGPC